LSVGVDDRVTRVARTWSRGNFCGDRGLCGRDGLFSRHDLVVGPPLMVTDILLLILSVAVFGYLGYAMIKPERF
jgi:K+-transporting ATPase KdpF subunit